LQENFERNKRNALERKAQARKADKRWKRIRVWAFSVSVSVIGFALVFPGRVARFIDDALSLRESYVEMWLTPTRWEGLYSTRPEGYVDVANMHLTHELDVFIALYYEPDRFEFDGEILSIDFCEYGWPYQNVLARGRIHPFFRNQMTIEVFDFVGGERIELGTIQAEVDPPVIEVQGWVFPENSRLAIDPVRTRDELDSLCPTF
jgi:hypothetical protein